MHGTPNIPIAMVMLFIFIICVVQNQHHSNEAHDFGRGKKKAVDDISYLNNDFVQEINDIEACVINQVLIYQRYCIMPFQY
jgi:hypothetical protein